MAEATIIDDNVSEMQKVLEGLEVSSNDLISVGEIRSAYASSLSSPPLDDKNKAESVIRMDMHAPISRMHNINGESIPTHSMISNIVTDAGIDTISVDHEIINTANKYTTLVSGMLKRLKAARQRLSRNRRRVEDINFICSSYIGMKDVQVLSDKDFSGKCTYSNGTFGAEAKAMEQVKYIIDDISGNGYVGNAYVLNSAGEYEQAQNDTSSISNITDGSPNTVFEYSRLVNEDIGVYTPNVQNKNRQTIVNFDDKDVECTISLHSEGNAFNTIVFSEPGAGVRVTKVEISDDGISYKDYLGKTVELDGNIYTAKGYSPGCNLIAIPFTRYAKVHLSSSAVANDYTLGRDVLSVDGTPKVRIEQLTNAKRKVISFGGIIAYSTTYQKSTILTGNLAPTNGCQKIAIFANSYIPMEIPLSKTPIKYEMIINGETYEVKPINSDERGIKIISGPGNTYRNTGTLFIDDKIYTAQLQITFEAQNEVSPYAGNIKACIG